MIFLPYRMRVALNEMDLCEVRLDQTRSADASLDNTDERQNAAASESSLFCSEPVLGPLQSLVL
jgi:hypothetical protein